MNVGIGNGSVSLGVGIGLDLANATGRELSLSDIQNGDFDFDLVKPTATFEAVLPVDVRSGGDDILANTVTYQSFPRMTKEGEAPAEPCTGIGPDDEETPRTGGDQGGRSSC